MTRSAWLKVAYLAAMGLLVLPMHYLSRPEVRGSRPGESQPGGLMVRMRSEHGLNELALRRVLESEVEAFDAGVAQLQLAAQPKVEFGIAGEALEIVEDHRVGRAALRI